jgi:hypothetical protein
MLLQLYVMLSEFLVALQSQKRVRKHLEQVSRIEQAERAQIKHCEEQILLLYYR